MESVLPKSLFVMEKMIVMIRLMNQQTAVSDRFVCESILQGS